MVQSGSPYQESTPRFLIAKYIPDLRRMEPRNIGVVLWNNGSVKAKFLGENPKQIKTPGFARDDHAYREWVEFWKHQVAKHELTDKQGNVFARESPDFLEALAAKSKEQFMLVDGGVFGVEIPQLETAMALAELFEALVAEPKLPKDLHHQQASMMLKTEVNSTLKETSIRDRPDFKTHLSWLCEMPDAKQHFEFDFAIFDSQPRMLMNKIPLWHTTEVQSLAFRFQAMQMYHKVPRQKTVAFVYATDELLEELEVRESYSLMKSVGEVINFAEPGADNKLLTLVG
jgi:hypothetical protein